MTGTPPTELRRCWWPDGIAGADPLMVEYHDLEWGAPVSDDRQLFEKLALDGFQAGLSWSTILRKRAAFECAFDNFELAVVAAYDDADRSRLMADAGIVRNRAKIDATIGNAQRVIRLQAEFGSLAAYLAAQLDRPCPTLPVTASGWSDIPATTPESDQLSADLRRRGFKFVGSTIVYAFMQSVGLVDDHLPGCHRYRG
jgi:DNA-3-methyladenine glycosylase I